MRYSTIPLAQTIILHCEAKGVQNIVISPGSRNAPLTIGFSENSFFKCFSIVDERCAAFFALGIAQYLQEPVALVCTSGSALLNYYPAVAEAFYSNIPLIVISADRPSYKIDIGDGQTIRQDDVFHRHIGFSVNLKQDVSHAVEKVKKYAPYLITENTVENTQEKIQSFNDTSLNEAINLAYAHNTPVHINVPFEEPLYDFIDEGTLQPNIVFNQEKDLSSSLDIEHLTSIWKTAKRKLVLVGVSHPNSIDQEVLDILADDPSVIVFTETTSNLHHPNFFPSIDTLVAPIEKLDQKDNLFRKLQPEILLTFGGLIVSKKIKAFLRQYKAEQHWHIDEIKAYDTFFSLSHHIKMDPNRFLKLILSDVYEENTKGNYRDYWQNIKENFRLKRLEYIHRIPFSDLLAFYYIGSSVPRDYQLHLANSSTIRYAQLFNWHPSIKMFCNRGTSGIDGSTSTAIGASVYSKKPTLLITGDLSFFYDSNAFWNGHIRSDFRILLINNGGGGIFRILPGKEDTPNFETYFETVQNLDAKHICNLYGFEHTEVSRSKDLEDALKFFYEQSDKPKLLEIRTPRLLNDKILLGYFDFLSSDFINH
ncbi:2-succinyl-5-enolpyruvyl-6-hydroxy-3-cyclohexene-1-carboxylic-acid synthase [Ulvibacterium marinum]|uniref:2-succinyl-5-enolpyruvyl-6-hydroxy-3-cyclohexene-1-carboxylate synthase n=1 Tax=Ulvibacterium marinum TaxID=2419782 RepID=A0A3B0CCL0_9FLAO|nr:2-succinyl-5-enolpyruvyl-6-hydroxy-3-cyclohexene-1-carboxylic-acid synthase [Ulvibacterium marinum]RKN81457.1 2-succinyl-5-enolpyruvyl-6-hydroxy-3-cyclohexene-1-carboxylic-acid synthase [Ulvibacterium marinum]